LASADNPVANLILPLVIGLLFLAPSGFSPLSGDYPIAALAICNFFIFN